MYFRSFVSVPVLALTFDAVVGVNYKLDFDCVHAKCSAELMECSQDGDSSPLIGVKHSYCRSVAACVHEDVVTRMANPMSCLDGVDHSNMSPAEVKIEACMRGNGCLLPAVDSPLTKKLPILAITTVKEQCMAQKCSSALRSCNADPVCTTLFECLDMHKDGDASRCVAHLDKLNPPQQSAVECGWSNQCFEGTYKPTTTAVTEPKQASTSAIADAPALNPLPAVAPTIVPLSDAAPAFPVKSSFAEIKPISFLSLSTATEAELKAAEATAERQAKAAEVAWEQSRKNTDSLLAKVHSEINALNQDLDKTTAQEKSDLTLLEDNRKKEDAELEATEKKLKELANTKVTLPSSFLQGFNTDDFLAPLRRAAQQARNFAKQIKDHSFFKSGSSSFLQNDGDDKASKALSLAEQALKKLDADIAAQKKELAVEEEKAKKEEQEAEAQAVSDFAAPASFLQIGSMTAADLKVAAATAEKQAKAAEEAWEASRAKTTSLLSKVHSEIDSLNEDLEKSTNQDKHDLVLLEENRKREDAELVATEQKLKALATTKVEAPAASFLEKSSSLDEILAPLRKAAEDAKHFAEQMRSHNPFKHASSFIETSVDDKASKALTAAENALKKLDEDIAAQKKELTEEEEKAKKEGYPPVSEETDDSAVAASFLQTGTGFDPLSPQALADWRDRFELQLQKAREAAGIHTPLHSALVQVKQSSFAENDQLREDERQVERLETQYNQQMEKLKADNAELLARAKEEMERAKDEENKVKSQLAQSSLLQTGHRYDPAKEEAHIRELERKWIREADAIVTPPQVVQQDNELQALIEQQRVKEAESEAQLDQMKQKLNKDIEIMNRDLAANSLSSRPVSFLQTGVKGPAEAALARAEADLQKLKKQLREETAKLNSMHFDS